MKQFFKLVFASMVGFFLSGIILFFFFILMIAAIFSAGGEKETNASANSVLHIRLNQAIEERTTRGPLDDVNIPGLNTSKSIGLNDIISGIQKAAKDDNIKGIYLDLSGTRAGMATAEEIRNALLDFKRSGKFILSYSEVYSKLDYYLASSASKIYINPEGILEFNGFHSDVTFYKGALDKLGIDVQVIKVGTYKSAVEPYITDHMSDANREQVTSFLGSLYDHYLDRIGESRRINKDSLFAIANDLKVQNARDAVTFKLVDGLKYKDEVLSELKKLTNTDEDKPLKSVLLEDYRKPDEKPTTPAGNRIAVVYAAGEIAGGESDDDKIGSEELSRDLRKLRMDDKIKAVVLRINSPGGSSLASDVIWREVILTRKVKPVIVSMGDVAASGGYYIACGADSIFAEPNTITGSIGVFGLLPNMQKLYNDKLGITFDGVKTGKFADLGSTDRPLTTTERLIIQREVNRVYDAFTSRVAKGRKKTQEYVNGIGQGRVWSGREALKNGLVDRLGDIDDAVKSAARMAKLKDYKLVNYPVLKDPIQSIFDNSGDKLKDFFTKMQLGDQYPYYQQLKTVANLKGIQSRMLYNLSVN